MSDDFNNPDGSGRRAFHPPPHGPPFPHQQPHFFQQLPYFQSQPYYERMTFNQWSPPRQNVRQTFRQQISFEGQISRGSQVAPVRVPVPIQTSTPNPAPSPPVVTPQPAPLPPPPGENVERRLVVTASVQLEENHEKDLEQIKGTFGADAFQKFTALGEALGLMQSSFKDHAELLTRSNQVEIELKAKIESLNVQLKETEEKLVSVNEKSEQVVKKAENDIQLAKREETIWRENYMKLNKQLLEKDERIESLLKTENENEAHIEDLEARVVQLEMSGEKLNEELTSLKIESERKVEQIELFETKVSENETQINNQVNKIRSLNLAVGNLKGELDEKHNRIQIVEGNFEKKCDELSKLKEEFNNLCMTNQVNQAAIKNLDSEKNSLELNVKELEGEISERVNEISRMSRELEAEKNENQNRKLALEKKIKRICQLKNKINMMEKRNEELLESYKPFHQIYENFSKQKRRKRVVSRSSSSSSEKESSPEPSSMQVGVNEDKEDDNCAGASNEAEGLDGQEDAVKTTTIGKRKFPIRKSNAAKKRCGEANCSSDHEKIPHQAVSQKKSNTGSDGAIPEVSSSSRTSVSPNNSGRQQRSCTKK